MESVSTTDFIYYFITEISRYLLRVDTQKQLPEYKSIYNLTEKT